MRGAAAFGRRRRIVAAHIRQRVYVDLFEEDAKKLVLSVTRGITCIAAAHCHQDAGKIERYQSHYSRPNEHFFTDPEKAEKWITEWSTGY